MASDNSKKRTDVTFRPRARIMRTLGEELISSDSVAIVELVKNSYDADASEVLIKFVAPVSKNCGEIHVIDNGVGMSIDTVRMSWMELATPNKTMRKTSPLGRKVLGEKGIGRFAAARLAKKTDLVSKRITETEEVHAFIDWSQFDDDNKYLDEIQILTEERKASDILQGSEINKFANFRFDEDKRGQGTILRLIDLKSTWEESNFEELQRALSRLISPFSEISKFNIRMLAPPGFEKFSSNIGPPEVVKYPHYTISGFVDAHGNYEITYSVEGTGYKEVAKGKFVYGKNGWSMGGNSKLPLNTERDLESGPIRVELRVWDRDDLGNVVQIAKSTISNVRRDLDSYSGVNIYRDGFRVLPYGEPNNDWLRLDLRRVQNPSLRLSNNQILGYIAISADANPDLKDQSNREGLRENTAKSDLVELITAILAHMEVIRKRSRKSQAATSDSKPVSTSGIFSPPDLSIISQHILSNHPGDAVAQQLVVQVEKDLIKKLDDIKKVVARYQGLATLGQLIDLVLHQGRQPLSKITNESTLGREDIEDIDYSTMPLLVKLHKRLAKIEQQSGVLDGVFRRVEPFGGRKRGRPGKLYLEQIIHDSLEIFSDVTAKSKVKVQVSDTKTLVTVDPAELQEVFVNLIQNSLYWLETVDVNSRKILVSVKRLLENHVEILFSDSGPGVPDENRNSIFDPYFSTRKDGTGLGLSLSGEIISDYYGGALELMDSGKLGGATFKITLKKRV